MRARMLGDNFEDRSLTSEDTHEGGHFPNLAFDRYGVTTYL
jgi:hypothetical protein